MCGGDLIRAVFGQLMIFPPLSRFTHIVERYCGDHRVRSLSCAEKSRAMALARLTCRESLRGIAACASAHASKLNHMDFHQAIRCPTSAAANQRCEWRIKAALAHRLIAQARKLNADEDLKSDLTNTVHDRDAASIAMSPEVFAWTPFGTIKVAVRLHTPLDLRGNIPSFVGIPCGIRISQVYPQLRRRSGFKDGVSGKTPVFINNNFALPAATICAPSNSCGQIEHVFMRVKQPLGIM